MLSVTKRNNLTSRGWVTLTPWNNKDCIYSVLQINLGTNSISNLEVVSSLNLANLGAGMYQFTLDTTAQKYALKVHLGTVQTMSIQWNIDAQKPSENSAADPQKSGSWPHYLM